MQPARNIVIILGSITVFALGGCGSDGKQGVMLVDHYKVPCEGVGPALCLLATELDGTQYSYFYDSIQGFDYQWGHRYALRVDVTEIEDPPADGSSLQYDLVEVVSDEVVDEHFDIELSASHVEGDPATGTFSLLGERELTCAEQAICDAIAAALDVNEPITVELGHGSSPAEPLIVYSTR